LESNAESRELKPFRGIFNVLLFLLGVLVVTVLISSILVPILNNQDLSQVFFPGASEAEKHSLVWQTVSIPLCAGTLLLAWFFCRKLDRRKFSELGFQVNSQAGIHGLIGLLAGGAIMLFVAAAVALSGEGIWRFSFSPSLPGLLFSLLALVGLSCAALTEEVLCRGYIQINLKDRYGFIPAVLIGSLIFAVLHSGNNGLSMLGLVNLFLAGLMLALLREKCGNLWAPWALHFSWNFVMGPVLGVPVSGLNMPSLFTYIPGVSLPGGEASSSLLSGSDFGFEGGLAVTVVTFLAIFLIIGFIKPQARSQQPELNQDNEISETFLK
jgi:CAAX protease family protein